MHLISQMKCLVWSAGTVEYTDCISAEDQWVS